MGFICYFCGQILMGVGYKVSMPSYQLICDIDVCDENQQLGFIKFGSRVDLYLPMDSEILVGVGQKVTGNQTVIAKVKKPIYE